MYINNSHGVFWIKSTSTSWDWPRRKSFRKQDKWWVFCSFSLYNGGIFSEYPNLPAFHLSGTPSLKTGTRPPSCLHLDNHLYIQFKNDRGKLFLPHRNGTTVPCTDNWYGTKELCWPPAHYTLKPKTQFQVKSWV